MSASKRYNTQKKAYSYKYRKKKKKRKTRAARRKEIFIHVLLFAVIVVCAIIILKYIFLSKNTSDETDIISYSLILNNDEDTDEISEESASKTVQSVSISVQQMLLTPNEYSRPQIALEQVNAIVVHYTGNSGTTAAANRDYFEELKTGETGVSASSHFIIGLDGEIIQCIPLNEISYASNERNYDTISIECCHPDESGEFTEATYRSLINLCTWLCNKYSLDASNVIRHYDITGKQCPLYYVVHEDAWEAFRSEVSRLLSKLLSDQ